VFIGRERELAFLQAKLDARASALVPVYGRRRVGKTELLRRFVADKRAIYHVGRTAPAKLLIRDFLQQLAVVLDEPLVAELPDDDWRRPLELISRHRGPDKLVVVFDEFQWTAGTSPGLQGLLQELWDLHWRDSGQIFLILCGSYIGFMEREVLGAKAPLFGRRTGQIFLKPLPYRTAAELHPRWSLRHRAEAYFLCGGIPAYLRCFDDSKSIEANIRDVILSELGTLRREPEFLLREELREVERYHAVLHAIATGKNTAKEIAAHVGMNEGGGISYYLQQLVDLRYIARKSPLTHQAPKRINTRYVLDDPIMRFWFRFVFPHESYLERAGAAAMLRDRVRPELAAYYGACFERLCQEALADLYVRDEVPGWQIGEYWDKSVQIDVVGLREDGWTDLGECKWGAVRSAAALEKDLHLRAAHFPNLRGDSIGLHAFVRKKPKKTTAGLQWLDLEDLYALG